MEKCVSCYLIRKLFLINYNLINLINKKGLGLYGKILFEGLEAYIKYQLMFKSKKYNKFAKLGQC